MSDNLPPPSPTGREAREALAQTCEQFADVVCPKLAELLVPHGATASGWADAAEQLRHAAAIVRAAALGAAAPVPADLYRMALEACEDVTDQLGPLFDEDDVGALPSLAAEEITRLRAAAAPVPAGARERGALRGLLAVFTHDELNHVTDAEARLCGKCEAVRRARAALATPSSGPPVPAAAREQDYELALRQIADGAIDQPVAYARAVLDFPAAPSSGPAVPAGEPLATLGRLRQAVADLLPTEVTGMLVLRRADVLALIDAEIDRLQRAADGPAGERELVRFALSFLCGFLASRRDPALSPAEWGQCCAEAVRQAMIEYQVRAAALPSRADAPAPEREPSVARAIQAGVDFFARYWGRSQTDLAEMRDFFEAVAAAALRPSRAGAGRAGGGGER